LQQWLRVVGYEFPLQAPPFNLPSLLNLIHQLTYQLTLFKRQIELIAGCLRRWATQTQQARTTKWKESLLS